MKLSDKNNLKNVRDNDDKILTKLILKTMNENVFYDDILNN